MEIFAPLSADILRVTEKIPALLDKTFPLPGRFRAGLPRDVAELSRLLTSARGERELSYLSRPNLLSAYLRYFLPWNIFRLCRLLPGLDISLAPGDVVLDLGSGPLSFASALWISRPELRGVPLELRCVDRTGAALEAGKKFFAALAGEVCPWKIVTVKGEISPRGTLVSGGGKKRDVAPNAARGKTAAETKPAALVCAINVFNEIYGGLSNFRDLAQAASSAARLMDSLASSSASILAVEPGVPRSGEFIRYLRAALIERDRLPLSPCTHGGECPFPGGGSGAEKKRWCHFAFETVDAPAALHKLSAAAGIPKERAVLSFLFAGPKKADAAVSAGNQTAVSAPALSENGVSLRVISDAFPVPGGNGPGANFGCYCCSRRGLVLLAGKRERVEACHSGALVNGRIAEPEQRDGKSGAVLAEL